MVKKKLNNTDVVKIAEQKRHLFLLEKVQQGKPLSEREIVEIRHFEAVHEPHEGCVNSIENLAKIFKVDRRTAYRWNEEGMPWQKDGWWNIVEVQKWRESRNKKKEQEPEGQFEAKIAEVRYNLLKLNYEERIGDVISLAKVKEDIGSEILIIKQQFLSLPRQIAPQLFGLEIIEIEELLEKKLKEIISGFAKGKYR